MDIMDMMSKMRDMQGKLKEAQKKLRYITAEGEAGGDMVKAVVNGIKEVVSVTIDPEMLNASDKQILQDLIVAAINKAMNNVELKTKQELQKSTQGIVPNIPGLDFGSLMN